MSYCSKGETAIVSYSFAEGAQKYSTDKSPIDVISVTDLPGGQCQGMPYRIIFWYVGQFGRYGNYGYITDLNVSFNEPFTTVPIWGAIVQIRQNRISGRFFLDVLCYGEAGAQQRAGNCWLRYAPTSGLVWYAAHNVFSNTENASKITGFEIVEIVTDTQTAQGFNLCQPFNYSLDCGSRVKIEISKDGQLLFSDTGKSPCNFSVECKGSKCPPETCCECDCGDVICCYGSNGQVIKTISK